MPFDDVPTTHPFYHEIEAVAAAGISRGTSVSPPMFSPETTITVGEMDSWLTRAAHYKDSTKPESTPTVPPLSIDVQQSHGYYGYVQRAIAAGIHGGPERVDYDPGYVESSSGGPAANLHSIALDGGVGTYVSVGSAGMDGIVEFTIAARVKAPAQTSPSPMTIFYASNEGSDPGHTLSAVALVLESEETGHTVIQYWQTTIQFNGLYFRWAREVPEGSITDSTWHSVVGIRRVAASSQTGYFLSLFIDGVYVINSPCGSTALDIVSAYIGQNRPAGTDTFLGNIDDVRVYSRALSDAEVADLHAGRTVSSASLIDSWQFEEGTGTTTTNSAPLSPPGPAGTLVGGVTWSNDVPNIGGGGGVGTVPPSRGMTATFIIRALGERPADTGSPPSQRFTDVAIGSQFYNYIQRAFELSIVGLTPTYIFNPTGDVTRASLACFLKRAFNVPYVTGPVGDPQGE